MQKLEVTIEQVGKSGKIICDTNIGISFIANYRHQRVTKTATGMIRASSPIMRYVEFLSLCCQSACEKRKIQNSGYFCGACGKESVIPEEYHQISLELDQTKAQEQFEKILSIQFDPFEAVFYSTSLVTVLNQIFESVENGERIRSIFKTFEPKMYL